MSTGAQPVTVEQARRLAGEHAAQQIRRDFESVDVKDGKDVRLGISVRTKGDFWVVYQPGQVLDFRSSNVILVCKRTGRILYSGSACDEG